MADFIILAIIALLIGSAVWHIRREKKRGVKCIGCPEGCGGCSGCCNQSK